MTAVRRALAVAVLAGAPLAGCGDSGSTPDDPSTETAVEPSPDPTSSSPQPRLVADAVTDLATMLGVEESDVEVVSQEEVTWRDGSLGCAQEGTMYTQALVDGSRIVLRVDGTDYEYHSGRGKPAFYCANPTE